MSEKPRNTEIEALERLVEAFETLDTAATLRVVKYVLDMKSIAPDALFQSQKEAGSSGTSAKGPRRNEDSDSSTKEASKEFVSPPLFGSKTANSIPTPAEVKVFMRKTGVTDDDLSNVFHFEDGQVHFIKEPSHNTVAKGQIEWALLIALKSAILGKGLKVDPEDVRSVCQEKGFYDKGNFAAIFKRPNNAPLFRGVLEPQGSAQNLTDEGSQALGKLVRTLAGHTE